MTDEVQVLIVDDQLPFREASRLVVELTDGFDVAGEATNGDQALELAAQLQPDLVLMDVQMPGMDGIEATRRIKASWPGIRVIGLSMYDEADRSAAMIQAGASAYVAKASGTDALLEAIRGLD